MNESKLREKSTICNKHEIKFTQKNRELLEEIDALHNEINELKLQLTYKSGEVDAYKHIVENRFFNYEQNNEK